MSRKPSKRMDETGSQRFFRILRGILSYLFVIIILIVSLVPIVWVFMSSFKSNTEILNSALSLPTVWSLKNYVTAFEMVPIATFYGNSAVVAVVATLLNVLVLSMSSYVLARFRFKGSRKLKSLFGLALLIPSAALLQPLYLTMKTLGFYDQLLGLIICYAAFSLPVSMYILTSYYLTIPLELEEAAYIDGANSWQTLWRVKIPNVMPSITICLFLTLTNSFKLFDQNLALTGGEPAHMTEMLALNIYNTFYGRSGAQWKGYGQAKAVIFCVLVIVISMIQLRATRSKEVQQ